MPRAIQIKKQGAAGVMSITGDSDSAPLRVGYPLADTVGGMTAAFAIAAALNARPRGTMLIFCTESPCSLWTATKA